MTGAEAQSSDEVAQVILNLVKIKMEAKQISDIPFNFGTSRFSQVISFQRSPLVFVIFSLFKFPFSSI